MINAGWRRRWPTVLPAIALVFLAGSLPTPSLHWNPPGSALAAENAEPPDPGTDTKDDGGEAPDQSEEPQEADDGSDETKGKSDQDESEEVFVPSEDISEDIDVPFPVDI